MLNPIHPDFFMDDEHVRVTQPPRVLYRCDGCSTCLVLRGANVGARRDWQPVTYFVADDAYMRMPRNGHMRCVVRSPHPDWVEMRIDWDQHDTQHDGFTFACALECEDMIQCSTPFLVLHSRPPPSSAFLAAPSPLLLL